MDATHKLSLNILGPYPEPPKEPEPEQEEISPTQSTDQPAGDDVTKPVDDVTAPVLLYRTGNSHELTTDIFTEWFYSNFVPQVKESLTRRGLPCKAVLIMDNSMYHPDNLSGTHPHTHNFTLVQSTTIISYTLSYQLSYQTQRDVLRRLRSPVM